MKWLSLWHAKYLLGNTLGCSSRCKSHEGFCSRAAQLVGPSVPLCWGISRLVKWRRCMVAWVVSLCYLYYRWKPSMQENPWDIIYQVFEDVSFFMLFLNRLHFSMKHTYSCQLVEETGRYLCPSPVQRLFWASVSKHSCCLQSLIGVCSPCHMSYQLVRPPQRQTWTPAGCCKQPLISAN